MPPSSSAPRRSLLGVFGHPDDESLLAGGVLAQHAAAGAATAVVTATWAPDSHRAGELVDALDILGAGRPRMLGFADARIPDSAPGRPRLCDAPLEEVAGLIVEHIRAVRPQVVVTHDAYARDQDTVVQDLCATAALTALGDEEACEGVLPPLLSARNPRTRAAGVTALRRAGRSKQAEPFLSDRSALVRACARYVVRQQGGDPAAWYRERCSAPDDPELSPGAVIGLAECGNRADASLLWPLLVHPAAGVRARAVAGLRALDCVDAKQLWPLLDDPAAGVVRETAAALLPSAKELPAERLLERTSSEQPRHVRVGAFRLLDARGGIVALRAAVGLFEDPDIELRTWAGQSVQRWHPSPDGRRGDAEVGELLDRSRHLFSDHVLRRRKWEAGVDS
ncbi:PIG-L deacetylase family protein [Streptomyces sp. NPDC058255]|uniref:PIG-L deacetylase family protein n=1 Tax=Streptomyces sp. NPDC058255 TaxID=3346407 RepID=UPI0036E8555A